MGIVGPMKGVFFLLLAYDKPTIKKLLSVALAIRSAGQPSLIMVGRGCELYDYIYFRKVLLSNLIITEFI